MSRYPFIALSVLAVAASFAVGIKSSNNVKTVASMEASGTRIPEDINDDGLVDVRDAIAVLEVSQGYKKATPDELLADPNQDGKLTADDAIRILTDISSR